MSAITQQRHFALRHRLDAEEASAPASDHWVAERIHHYAAVAHVGPVVALVRAEEHQARSGRPVDPFTWGNADWSGSELLVYVDPAKCGTKGAAELVVAHEVGHLRWRSYRHREVFFTRVQDLIDQANEHPSGPRVPCSKGDLDASMS